MSEIFYCPFNWSFCCGRVFVLFSLMDRDSFSGVVLEAPGQRFVFMLKVTNQMNPSICWMLRYGDLR